MRGVRLLRSRSPFASPRWSTPNGPGSVLRSLSTSAPPSQAYAALVASGAVASDGAQVEVLKALDRLHRVLEGYDPAAQEAAAAEEEGGEKKKKKFQPRGLYVWGQVGTGKSMCMDIFFANVGVEKRRRVHFHQFMLEVHRRIHAYKKDGKKQGERDLIGALGSEMAGEAALLCFDEMQVTDIADAMILRRLFDALFRAGVVVVATSNRPPEDLYENGLNREYFVPFVDQLAAFSKVVEMRSSSDHRVLNAVGVMGSEAARYVVDDRPIDDRLKAAELALAPEGGEWKARTLEVGDSRRFVCQLTSGDSAVFRFDELCARDVGAADYAAITRSFNKIAILDLPKLDLNSHDVARRFITLVDEIYERRVALYVFAEAPPEDLFPTAKIFEAQLGDASQVKGVDRRGGPRPKPSKAEIDDPNVDDTDADATLELSSVRELSWAFRRAASRLFEMANPTWPASALRS